MERWNNLDRYQKGVLILSVVMLIVFSVLYLIYKGSFLEWFGGALFCIIAVVTILFADELFYIRMSFRVENINDVEPSDLEIARRYIGWTLEPIIALAIFLMGLPGYTF